MSRRWFQFHLLTLVLLTAAAGALIGANIVPQKIQISESSKKASYGWPLVYSEPIPELKLSISNPCEKNGRTSIHIKAYDSWDTVHALINLAVAFIILTTLAFTSEYILRRRDRARPDSIP